MVATIEPGMSLPKVSEVVIRKRKSIAEVKAKRSEQVKNQQIKAKASRGRKAVFKRAETFVREHRAKSADNMRLRRIAKTEKAKKLQLKTASPETESNKVVVKDNTPAVGLPVVFAIRLLPMKGTCADTRKSLMRLRLWQLNSGVFVRLDERNAKLLQKVSPYVAWGKPDNKTIRELVVKRGVAKINGKRTAITDNALIEKELGEKGLICLDDIIHEITVCGEHFNEANNFLWPFKLSQPKQVKKFKKVVHHKELGVGGDRGDGINELIQGLN
eukprot:CFRG8322T1